MSAKAREAGVIDDDDATSVASSFASVGRPSPTLSISTTALDQDEPPPYSLSQPSPGPPQQPCQPLPIPQDPLQDLSRSPQSLSNHQYQQPSYFGPEPTAGIPRPTGPPNQPQSSNQSPWTNQDPRSASSESLITFAQPADVRRRLLLIYVHGFMGNETSFQSFPAHVHNLLSVLLAESHIVHTKIYPRYLTRKALQIATQEFSDWLAPHHKIKTDVVLLGHSMGGLLAVDAALTRDPVTQLLRHCLLGVVSFDAPFLGMHPGVVWSGLSSMFRPAPSPSGTPDAGPMAHQNTLIQTSESDPHFNPAFPNDNHLPVRTAWDNTMHFVNKHSRNLTSATKQLLTSHVEFGSALADNKALKRRHSKIKALDSEHPVERVRALEGLAVPKRTRFVNYYTASTGRPKKTRDENDEQSARSVDTFPNAPTNDPCSADDTLSRPTTNYSTSDHRAELGNITTQGSGRSSMSSNRFEDMPNVPRTELTRPDGTDGPAGLNQASNDQPSSRLRATSSTSKLRAMFRNPSPTPSYGTLPSYTSEAPPLTPAPSYPYSNADSATTTPSLVSSERTVSRVRSDSTTTSTAAPQSPKPPSPLGPPPLPSDFPKDPAAYGAAIKAYLHSSTEYAMALKQYHKSLGKQRKAEFHARIRERKDAMKMTDEERKLERLLREEEQRRIAEAPTDDAREIEVTAMRERHRRELAMRRDQVKARVEQAKENGKSIAQAAKAERKAVQKMVKEDRKAQKQFYKDHRKELRSGFKDASKDCRRARSDSNRPRCPGERLASLSESHVGGAESTSDGTELQTMSTGSTYPEHPVAGDGTDDMTRSQGGEPNEGRKQKDRKFCRLPPKDGEGNRDPNWIRVFMQDVDEVGAHTGLFFPKGATGSEAIEGQAWGERYGWLVSDVAERIETWAQDEMTERVVSGIEAL